MPGSTVIEATVRVESRDDLVELYYPNGRLGGLTVPGKPPGALGQPITLNVVVEKPARAFLVHGQIAWVRHKPGPNQPAGYGVDFSLEDDAARLRLLAFARKEVNSDYTRVEVRKEVELQVRLVHEGRQRKEWMADLSHGGAFVRTWNPLPVGARVSLQLRTSLLSLKSLTLPAMVAWVRLAGDHPGMGLSFDAVTDDARTQLDKVLARSK